MHFAKVNSNLSGSLSEKDASQEVSDEIAEEIIEDISEVSEDKSVGIEINLKSQKEKEDMYDVTVSYTEDFTADDVVTGGTTLHEKLALSPRSEVTEPVTEPEPKTVPLSARSGTEISEQISEAAGSISESIIKPLDFVKDEDIEKIIKDDRSEDQESDEEPSPSSLTRTDSRPSSEKSERSLRSFDHEHESSESEKSPLVTKQDKFENELIDEISEPSRKSTGPMGKVLDIDDLLRMDDDMQDEETPVASPRRTPVEISQRDSETPKMDETPREDETPRGGIDTLLDETPQDTPRSEDTPRNGYEIHHARLINALADFELGDRVSVTGPNGTRNYGTLLFKGNVQFAPGIWAGVELDRPVGRHDGTENGVRYFRCRLNHGVIVPGDDLMPAEEDEENKFLSVRSSIESTTSQDGEDLINLINEADKNVQLFDSDSSSPSPRVPQNNNKRKQEMADKITDSIFDSVIRDNFSKISEIADKKVGRKIPPPVAPKPKGKPVETDTHLHNGDIDDLEEFLHTLSPRDERDVTKDFESTASSDVNHLMNDAIDHMLAIRNNRMAQDSDRSRDSGNFTDGVDDNEQGPTSPTEELEGVLNKKDSDEQGESPLRPGSPIPGLQSQAVSTDKLLPICINA